MIPELVRGTKFTDVRAGCKVRVRLDAEHTIDFSATQKRVDYGERMAKSSGKKL